MKFEWDKKKSASNEKKHGIDFIEAQHLWLSDPVQIGPKATELSDGKYEDRYLVIGEIDDDAWTAIITMRGKKVRIISCRRARKEEVRLYEESQD